MGCGGSKEVNREVGRPESKAVLPPIVVVDQSVNIANFTVESPKSVPPVQQPAIIAVICDLPAPDNSHIDREPQVNIVDNSSTYNIDSSVQINYNEPSPRQPHLQPVVSASPVYSSHDRPSPSSTFIDRSTHYTIDNSTNTVINQYSNPPTPSGESSGTSSSKQSSAEVNVFLVVNGNGNVTLGDPAAPSTNSTPSQHASSGRQSCDATTQTFQSESDSTTVSISPVKKVVFEDTDNDRRNAVTALTSSSSSNTISDINSFATQTEASNSVGPVQLGDVNLNIEGGSFSAAYPRSIPMPEALPLGTLPGLEPQRVLVRSDTFNTTITDASDLDSSTLLPVVSLQRHHFSARRELDELQIESNVAMWRHDDAVTPSPYCTPYHNGIGDDSTPRVGVNSVNNVDLNSSNISIFSVGSDLDDRRPKETILLNELSVPYSGVSKIAKADSYNNEDSDTEEFHDPSLNTLQALKASHDSQQQKTPHRNGNEVGERRAFEYYDPNNPELHPISPGGVVDVLNPATNIAISSLLQSDKLNK